MDPSIMKLLDDDEDETLHSGADVEAFTAALNRDIKGEPSTSQSVDSASGILSQINKVPLLAQWQNSIMEKNTTNQNLQDSKILQEKDQHSSEKELVQHGPDADSQQQHQGNSSLEHNQLPLQQNQSQDDQLQCQAEQNAAHSQKNAAQISEQNTANNPEESRMHLPHNQLPYQKLPKMSNQQVPPHIHGPVLVSEQANNSLIRNKQVPFVMILPAILPHLEKDKAMQLTTLFHKLRTNEIEKDGFIRLMRNIVGDRMLKLAVQTIQAQEMAKEQAVRKSQTGANQFQKGDIASTGPSQVTSSTVHLQNDFGLPKTENNAKNPMESEHHQSESQGTHLNQMPSTTVSTINQGRGLSAIQVRGNMQQQQHLHLPQNSFPTYGVSSQHPRRPYSMSHVSPGLTSVKPQAQGSQMMPVPLHHGMGSTQPGGASQPLNMTNTPNEPKRFHGGSTSHPIGHSTLQHAGPWQSSMNNEQNSGLLSSMASVKQEFVDQIQEQHQKSQFSAIRAASFGTMQLDQENAASPGTLKDGTTDKQSSRNPFSTSTTSMPAISASVPMATQMDPSMVPSTNTLGAGINVKTPPKKPLIGQKKPLDALGNPLVATKKQKLSGAFLDQSIEQLNDVTAVSGVNVREEEEQLLSGPKEDSRASEATRRVVQEEEDRLFLQKTSLQKKLANIMAKCGIKNISNDVERCLSLCVEERLHAFIRNLIRLSKQRVDIERPKHRTFTTSDVGRQILLMNRKAKDEWEKKKAEETEKLRKLNEADGVAGADGEKDKDENRSKAPKANKEEDDKMRATAANVAARVAVGGDDMLSKWQLMAEQARQKREGGDMVCASQASKDVTRKSTSGRTSKDNQGGENRGFIAASGATKNSGKEPLMPQTKIERSISIKDVVAALEREQQMSKSPLIYRLYDRMQLQADAPAE